MKEITDSVFYADQSVIRVGQDDVENLKKKALESKIVRSRLCMHKNTDSIVQEMFIVHFRDTYVRPHKHLGKSESIHIIEGSADLIIFDDDGEIIEVISMGKWGSNARFYYRMDKEYFHTIMINSDVCVFHETTMGPFDKERDTILAVWTPPLEEDQQVKKYMDDLRIKTETFKPNQKD